jgi:hypothetical protein
MLPDLYWDLILWGMFHSPRRHGGKVGQNRRRAIKLLKIYSNRAVLWVARHFIFKYMIESSEAPSHH